MIRLLLSLIVAAPSLGAQTVWQLDREPAISVPKSVPPPERLPAFSHMFAAIAGTLQIPFALTLFEVGTDYILGRTENADGEQKVVLYRYTR